MTPLAQPRVRAPSAGLWPWSLFAMLIAVAGLPIYIHAPKYFADSYGVPLAALGSVLVLLRLVDVVQDPVLGWLAERTGPSRPWWVACAAGIMALSLFGLFAVAPPITPLLWFALTLTTLFTAFSFLTIVFYAEGVARAAISGPRGHVDLAAWRESGSLVGVSLAAVAPTILALVTDQPYAAFATMFCLLALLAVWAMHNQWAYRTGTAVPDLQTGWRAFRPALSDPVTRRLLVLAFVNAAPVAVTSTLFLLFVESRLGAPDLSGPLLLLFFTAAACSSWAWARLAQRYGVKAALLTGMAISVVSFLWTATLGTGDTLAFSVICVASGAALAADMTLLPALFARRLGRLGLGGEAAAFSLWSFVSKLSLAFAAGLLPVLGAYGFESGAGNPASALTALTVLYAVLPCALKLLAIGLLSVIPVEEA